jgi:HlyD family secretion protein
MRVDKLYQAGAATKKQLDDMDGNIDLIKKQILSIESQNAAVAGELGSISRQIDQAEVQLGRCHITNPVRGTVLRKYAEPGELAQAGKPLYKIADLTHLYLRVYVSGSLLPSVKIGDTADIFYDLDETSDQKTEGVISWVSSSAEFTPKIIQTKEERVNLVYAVKIRVPNDGRLKIGMPGEARFRNN